ncbi:penicillin-binding protein [Fusarium circinatum]|uniref:Penicillin-binding protein n=1 Tax=Fusarium circinatum TaxID=48490 RepID=A0A8H5WGR7_FUSCI|nr:penicillin-binding protein [Fusarium circinatum]
MDPEPRQREVATRRSLEAHAAEIEQLMKIGNTPGVSIAVLCNGKVVLERGYGLVNQRTNKEATASTIYPIASITKTFTAAACGILVGEGKLKWEEPISTYLQDIYIPEHSDIEKNATIVDILSHRTGLQEQSSVFESPNGMPLFKDALSTYRALNLMSSEPDTFRQTWSYCPPLYALLTLVIERVSGSSLSEFFKKRIFTPLGMASTSIVGTAPKIEPTPLAQGYTRTSAGVWLERENTSAGYQYPFDTSMGVQSSVSDMMKWAQVVIKDFNMSKQLSGSHEKQEEDLPAASAIFTQWCKLPANEGGFPSYCLGWFRQEGHFIFDDMFDGDGQTDSLEWPCTLPMPKKGQKPQTILYHSGLGHGFNSSMHVFPNSGDAVIVLGNSSHAGDAVDCISRLVTSIVCGHELSTVELRSNLRFYTDLEVGRWKQMDKELRREQESQPKRKRVAETSAIVGRYVSIGSALEMTIALGESKEKITGSRAGPFIGAKLKFGSEAHLALDLWSFSDDTLCFFPNELDYQRWCSVSGLWWQFDPARDGIWLQMLDS